MSSSALYLVSAMLVAITIFLTPWGGRSKTWKKKNSGLLGHHPLQQNPFLLTEPLQKQLRRIFSQREYHSKGTLISETNLFVKWRVVPPFGWLKASWSAMEWCRICLQKITRFEIRNKLSYVTKRVREGTYFSWGRT